MQCFGECVTMIGRRGLASEGIFLLRSQGWQRSDLLSQGRSASRESSQVQCFALTILTSFVAFDNISYNLPFFVYAFKSRKVMFITCAELARWWTKGVANFRFRKKPLDSDHIFEITKTLSWFSSQYDGPASCVPYTQCDPFSMMLTNLRKPFPLVSYRTFSI